MSEDSVEKLTLDDLAKQIVEHTHQTDDRIIRAAFMVQEARQRVKDGEAGKTSWTRWSKVNLPLSPTRLRELQRIAKAENPHEEHARVKKEIARRGKECRDRRKAALRNGGIEVSTDIEPSRRLLLERVRTAPLDWVDRILPEAPMPAGAEAAAPTRIGG